MSDSNSSEREEFNFPRTSRCNEESIDSGHFPRTDNLATSNKQNYKNLKIRDFIIAKSPTEKGERFYIGKIESISKEEFTLNTRRKKGMEKGFFVYPLVQDLSLIDYTQFHQQISLGLCKEDNMFLC